jgi:hypothetical protein
LIAEWSQKREERQRRETSHWRLTFARPHTLGIVDNANSKIHHDSLDDLHFWPPGHIKNLSRLTYLTLIASSQLPKYLSVGRDQNNALNHHRLIVFFKSSILTHHFSGSRVVQITTASGKALHSSPTNRFPGESVTATYPASSSRSLGITYSSLLLAGLGSSTEMKPLMNARALSQRYILWSRYRCMLGNTCLPHVRPLLSRCDILVLGGASRVLERKRRFLCERSRRRLRGGCGRGLWEGGFVLRGCELILRSWMP